MEKKLFDIGKYVTSKAKEVIKDGKCSYDVEFKLDSKRLLRDYLNSIHDVTVTGSCAKKITSKNDIILPGQTSKG